MTDALDRAMDALRVPAPVACPHCGCEAGHWTPGKVKLALRHAAPLLKPTCDENGNWRYVPAAEIDGPRALGAGPHHTRVDDDARVAVEGLQLDEVA